MRVQAILLVLVMILGGGVALAVSESSRSTSDFSQPTPHLTSSNSDSESWTMTPQTGPIDEETEVTITGTGFANLAFSNTTNDGLNHQWVETTADYTDEAGRWNAVSVDSNGHVHVVHINGGNYQIRHSVFDGTNWNSVKIQDCGQTYCWDVHMVIDENDELHAAYTTDSTWAETLVYMHYNGTHWTSQEVSPNANFGPVGIAVDSNNHPHISYAAEGDFCGNGLKLASFDGTSWGNQYLETGSNRGCESSIVIDENDHINVAYQNRADSKLSFITNRSGSWDRYTPDAANPPSSLYPGYMTSMVVDQQGQFHIAHFDDKEDDLRYSTGVPNGQWSTTIIDSSGHTGRDPSIALDFSGNPHIAYNSWSGWDLKYAVYNSTTASWEKSSLSTTGDVGQGNSMFIDQNGIIHVAFSDEDTNTLKYASKSTGLRQTNEVRVDFGAYGSVVGTVVNDTTITFSTPFGMATNGHSTPSIWDSQGNEHPMNSSFVFHLPNDLDSDGVSNEIDDCPTDSGTSTLDSVGCPDMDADGYADGTDAFPSDASQWLDTDGDGYGDNVEGNQSDACPNTSGNSTIGTLGCPDNDGDGVANSIDAFPNDATETVDTDADGVGDNSDMFPFDANETMDSDGDGVGDNADALPDDPFETMDSDGDGIGDNSDTYPFINNNLDSDADGYLNTVDAFPNDQTQWNDSDADGFGDNPSGNNSDAFVSDSTQWSDSDGDGYGDNWGNSTWNETRLFIWPGQFVDGAVGADHCPLEEGNSTSNGFFGCPDSDGDGNADIYDSTDTDNESENIDSDGDGVQDENDACPTSALGEYVDETGCMIDSDNDGIDDLKDICPNTTIGAQVTAEGCAMDTQSEGSSFVDALFSGGSNSARTTVGVGAIVLALLAVLQTNFVAALLPDAFRWVQVLRRSNKLTNEERNELTYLQSLVQAYFSDMAMLSEELLRLNADLTARYTNNEITKETRTKLNTLIEDLLSSSPEHIERIAYNDAYFGLIGTISTAERTELLQQELAMRDASVGAMAALDTQTHHPPAIDLRGAISADDGHEYIEYPSTSGTWFVRNQTSGEWEKWS